MPNKRDATKERISFYVDKKIKAEVKGILEKDGLTMTDFFILQMFKLLGKTKSEMQFKLSLFDGHAKGGMFRIEENKKSRE